MFSRMSAKGPKAFRTSLLVSAAVALALCSAACHKSPPKPLEKSEKPAARQPAKRSDVAKNQQVHYDRGIQYYSKEQYREARTEFQAVVSMGSTTVLGQKAQENIKKIQQIFTTLEEIESK